MNKMYYIITVFLFVLNLAACGEDTEFYSPLEVEQGGGVIGNEGYTALEYGPVSYGPPEDNGPFQKRDQTFVVEQGAPVINNLANGGPPYSAGIEDLESLPGGESASSSEPKSDPEGPYEYEEMPCGYATYDAPCPGPDPDFPPPIRNDAGDDIGTPGFWCNQVRFSMDGRRGARFPVSLLEEWLADINDSSMVFSERLDVQTLSQARVVLCDPEDARTMILKLQRHLLTLWFNLASYQVLGEFTLEQLCKGSLRLDHGVNTDMTVEDVLEKAEYAIVDGADDAAMEFWKNIIDFINNAQAPGAGRCPPL